MSRHIGQTFGVAANDYETSVLDFANAARGGKITIGPESGVSFSTGTTITADTNLTFGANGPV